MPNQFILNLGDGNVLRFEGHKSLPSTADLARTYAKAGYPDRFVVFSEVQTKINSLGEPIEGTEGEYGVYISCILRPSIFPSQASFIGAMSATAMINALEEHTTKRLGLGWVSDVYCEGKKIGCSGTEGKLDSFSSYEYIIVSYAVRLSPADFPPRLTDLVKKVFESENTSVSMIIAKNILSKFFALYPKRLKSPEKLRELYKQKFILRGRRIFYFDDGKRRICKVLAVDISDGTLIVETAGGAIKHITTPRNVIMPKKIKLKKVK